jgi:hypothetical protein
MYAHAERLISDAAILGAGCNEPQQGTRGKLSTDSVDKVAEKIWSAPDSRGIRQDSVMCLKIRQIINMLKTKERFLTSWQTLGKAGLFVTLA